MHSVFMRRFFMRRFFIRSFVMRSVELALLTSAVGMFAAAAQAASPPTGRPVVYAITPNNTITVVDTGSQAVINTLTLAGPAGYIVGTPDGKKLYVTGVDPTSQNPDGDAVVQVIDTETYTVKNTIPLNLFPAGMVISSDGTKVYVATTFSSQSAGEVAVIDTATNTVVARIESSQPDSVGIAISPNGTRVYVPMLGGLSQAGALDVIDTVSNALIASLNVPAGIDQYFWAAVSPDSSKVYTYVISNDGSDDSGHFIVLDAASNQQMGTAPIPSGGVLSTPLPNSSILYGTNGGSVIAFNTAANSVAATVPIASSIQDLALTPDGKQLYVSNSNAQSIAIIDTATNALAGSVPVSGATGMAIVAAPPKLVVTPPVPRLQLSPTSVPPGAPVSLTWTSTGAASCTASGAWSGPVGLQGSDTVSFAVAGSYAFTLSCTGPGGTAHASATLTVVAGSTFTASATDVPAGSNVVLSWQAFAGATACSGGGTWAGDLPTSGSTVIGPLYSAGAQQYSLYCAGPSGNETVTRSISVYTPGAFAYTSLTPANDNVYAFGSPGTAVPAGGLDGHGYAYDDSALPQPLTALGQTFAVGGVSKPNGISSQTVATTPAQLENLTILATAVNGNQLNQSFVVTYSDGTTSTYTQSLSDWASDGPLPGETEVISMNHRLTATGAQQGGTFWLHAYQITLDRTKVATSLQLPRNRDVIVFAINETKAPRASRESISSAFNTYGLATLGHASTNGRLDGHGYAYDAALLPNGFTGAGQQFTTGPADQVDAVRNSTIALPPRNRLGITVLAAAVNGNQLNQTFVVTYQDGSTSSFQQSVSDWNQPRSYPNESIARDTACRVTPTGVPQDGVWDVYAYRFLTDPNRQIVSLTLPENRDVVVFAVNALTP
jgi:YVTN family beta-propeller protein